MTQLSMGPSGAPWSAPLTMARLGFGWSLGCSSRSRATCTTYVARARRAGGLSFVRPGSPSWRAEARRAWMNLRLGCADTAASLPLWARAARLPLRHCRGWGRAVRVTVGTTACSLHPHRGTPPLRDLRVEEPIAFALQNSPLPYRERRCHQHHKDAGFLSCRCRATSFRFQAPNKADGRFRIALLLRPQAAGELQKHTVPY